MTDVKPAFDLKSLNENKFAWGVALLVLNMGSRFLAADLGKFANGCRRTVLIRS